jgi:CO/xanthine dehydrogenase FAD-binding subunit
VAAIVGLAADGSFGDLRVAGGAAAETPQRFPDVEREAIGQAPDDALHRRIADGYAERIEPLDDMRGSAWYRTEMVKVWVRRAIEHALAEARAAGSA